MGAESWTTNSIARDRRYLEIQTQLFPKNSMNYIPFANMKVVGERRSYEGELSEGLVAVQEWSPLFSFHWSKRGWRGERGDGMGQRVAWISAL